MASKSNSKAKVPLFIVLQGQLTSSSSYIFMFPDGSGSGLAYCKLPIIDPKVCLVAFHSPFLANPQEYSCSIEQCTRLWVEELRTIQPRGPYTLGGWSAGGYYAFEMAKSLLGAEEEISGLILIDSPCRLIYEALPMSTVEELAAMSLIGNWGAQSAPRWMLDHFKSTITAVEAYKPTPITRSGISGVYLIWAKGGVGEGAVTEPQVKVNQLLLRPRKEFSAMGWDALLPEALILSGKMDGNHFQLVHPPYCHSLTILLRSIWKQQASEVFSANSAVPIPEKMKHGKTTITGIKLGTKSPRYDDQIRAQVSRSDHTVTGGD